MESSTNSYIIVIPFYNGLETIFDLVSRIRKVGPWKVIIVDDSDNVEKSDQLQKGLSKISDIEVLTVGRNFGQHIATYVGMLYSQGRHVITMDEDLQFLPEEIPKMIANFESGKADVVYGCRQKQGFSDLLRISVLGILKPQIANVYPKETSSFRVIRSALVEKMCAQSPTYIQLEGMIMHNTKKYGYVNLEPGQVRTSGNSSSYNILSLYRMVIGLIKHYTLIPVRLFAVVSIVLTAFFLNQNNHYGYWLLPIAALGLFNIYGNRRIITTRKALDSEKQFLERP